MSQVDIQQQDLLLFVINDCGNHWTLLVYIEYVGIENFIIIIQLSFQVVDMHNKKAEYFDSMHCNNPRYWETIRYIHNNITKFKLMMHP